MAYGDIKDLSTVKGLRIKCYVLNPLLSLKILHTTDINMDLLQCFITFFDRNSSNKNKGNGNQFWKQKTSRITTQTNNEKIWETKCTFIFYR